MANRGAWAIAAMFGVGLILAGGSVLYHSGQGRRCLAFYGSEDAAMVRHAPQVEAWRLEPPNTEAGAEGGETIAIDGQPWRIARRIDIRQARGLVHARHALIVDANYRWDASASDGRASARDSRWSNALAFSRDAARVVLLFDFQNGQVRELEGPATTLVPTIAAAEQALIEREFSLADRRSPPRDGAAPAASASPVKSASR